MMNEDPVLARVSREQSESLCVEAVRQCGMTPEDARVAADGPAWAVMDGDNALAMISGCRAMQVGVDQPL